MELSKEAARSRARRAAAKARTAEINADLAKVMPGKPVKAAGIVKLYAKPRPGDKITRTTGGPTVKPKSKPKAAPTSTRLIVISFKGTPAQKATFQGLGGGSWLRPMLDKRA